MKSRRYLFAILLVALMALAFTTQVSARQGFGSALNSRYVEGPNGFDFQCEPPGFVCHEIP